MAVINEDIFNDISSEDLIKELESRGDLPGVEDFSTDDLFDELQCRGYTAYGKGHSPNIPKENVEELYITYKTMSPEFFEKKLKKFFREHLEVNEY
jgi:hypothetical protein